MAEVGQRGRREEVRKVLKQAHMFKKSERGKKKRCICVASKIHAAVEEKWEGRVKNKDFSQLLSYF